MDDKKQEKGEQQTNGNMEDEIIEVAETLSAIGDSISKSYESRKHENLQAWLQTGIETFAEIVNTFMFGFLLCEDLNNVRRDSIPRQAETRSDSKETCRQTHRREA